MAIKTIEYSVSSEGLSPKVRQDGGVQGDHRITELKFVLGEEFYGEIKQRAKAWGEKIYYRFDEYNGEGSCDSTFPQELASDTIILPLEEWITRYGGIIKAVLVLTVGNDTETQTELYSFPAVITLKSRPTAFEPFGKNYQSVAMMSQANIKAAKEAAESSETAVSAAEQAEAAAKAAVAAQKAFNLPSNVYVGSGEMPDGYDVQIDPDADFITVEDEVTKDSAGIVKSSGIYKALSKKANSDELKITFLGEGKGTKDMGLCAVMQVSGKTFIFDVGSGSFGESKTVTYEDGTEAEVISAVENPLISFLEEQGIEKIDGLILSHFHGENVGGIDEDNAASKGLEFFIKNKSDWFKDCTFYFPHQINGDYTFDGIYVSVYQSILEAVSGIEGAVSVYPSEEGYSVEIDENTVIRFYNVNSEYFQEYWDNTLSYSDYESGGSYNNFSMVTVIEHLGNKIAVTGDIEYLATKNVASAMSDVDVIQIENYGLNHRSHIDYLNNITAKIGIIPTYEYYTGLARYRPTADKIISNGGKVYYTGDCGSVVVVSDEGGVHIGNDIKPMTAHTSMSYNLDYGIKLLGGEDLNNLTEPNVYCASGAALGTIANKPDLIALSSKIIVEETGYNAKLIRQSVIAADTPELTMAYRTYTNLTGWTAWKYVFPSEYGTYNSGKWKINGRGDFEILLFKAFTPTNTANWATKGTGYYSEPFTYDLNFITAMGKSVNYALAVGVAGSGYTVTDGSYDSGTNSITFRLMNHTELEAGTAVNVRLLIKGNAT